MVGMLVDEHYADGIPVTMFNRAFPINPLFARFVRIFDCPFHGFYVARTPDGRLRLNVTDAIEPARDERGRVDVAGRCRSSHRRSRAGSASYPEQWLWMHRRPGGIRACTHKRAHARSSPLCTNSRHLIQ